MSKLECLNISKSYGAVRALRDVSLDVAFGEVRAILGGNGSGKSTLAKILGGAAYADSGEVRISGMPLRSITPILAKRNGIVVTSQELSLLANLTVEENLLLCGLPRRGVFTDRRAIRGSAARALDCFGLARHAASDVSTLAANQLYLLEFAKALVQRPRILVIDEITSALYRDEVALVKEEVHRLRDDGCCVLFISHRMNEIFDICDSVTVLRNGEHIDTCALADVDEDGLLARMSGQDVQKVSSRTSSYAAQCGDEHFLSIRGLRLDGFDRTIDLDIAKGEIIGVAGLQGNGQSGLVRALFALDAPLAAELEGRRTTIHNAKRAVHMGFAFVSGDREREGTFAIRSVIENEGVVTDLVLGKVNREKEGILREYGVAMRSVQQPIRTLSGGNQQKVVLARWTSAKPSLLLADDPTKGIDVNARSEVHQFIRALAASGAAVVFVSSDSEELVKLTGLYENARVIVMYRGQIVHSLAGEEITAENIAYHEVPRETVSHVLHEPA
ncbi:MAG: sugar ABC transporter ATP-binding protein [Planctomycetota bacterium]|jgi:ABC-type sugar transport system ATPase subunit|nr:sugar ABC transporter ATP-binding protein [Planctomycetota bacterium]